MAYPGWNLVQMPRRVQQRTLRLQDHWSGHVHTSSPHIRIQGSERIIPYDPCSFRPLILN